MKLFSGKCTSKARLDGKTAIVTGSSSGIGKATAENFYRRGARVIMACRNIEKANSAVEDIKNKFKDDKNAGELIVTELDLSLLNSIKKFVEHLNGTERNVNILVNNAGILCPSVLTEDGFEIHFETNYLGHFLLTLLLLPKLVKSGEARIINVSSIGHAMTHLNVNDVMVDWKKVSTDPVTAYHQSKLANILFTRELAKRLKAEDISNVTVYSVHPGFTNTDLLRHLDKIVFAGSRWLFQTFLFFLIKTPQQGSETTIHCAVDEKIAYQSGLYYSDCDVAIPSSCARNDEDAKRLWGISLKLVDLEENYNPF